MAEPLVGSSTRTQLPHELVIIILRYALSLDVSQYLTHLGDGEAEKSPISAVRERLKPLRLEGRAFCDAVTPAVFASIHLHGSHLSTRRAEDLAASRLGVHVKEVIHHQGTFAGRNRDRKLFQSTLASHRRRQDYPEELKAADGDQFYINLIEEIQAAERFLRAGGWQTYPFEPLVSRLQNCRTFVSVPYHDEWHDPETSAYTLKRTGLAYLPMSPRSSSFHSSHRFTSSMTILRPRSLDLSLFMCEAVHALVGPMDGALQTSSFSKSSRLACAKERYDRLKDLKIGPAYGAKYGYGGDEQWTYDTMLLIQACDNLVSLELTNDYPVNPRFAVLPEGSLPSLERLTISKGTTSGCWPGMALLECITNIGTTLQHLRFKDILLKHWPHSPDKGILSYDLIGATHGYLIGLLYQLTQHTNLRSCSGLESVGDIKSDITFRSANIASNLMPGKEALLRKLEEAACHRRPWPSRLSALPCAQFSGHRRGHIEHDNPEPFICAHWDDTIDAFDYQ